MDIPFLQRLGSNHNTTLELTRGGSKQQADSTTNSVCGAKKEL